MIAITTLIPLLTAATITCDRNYFESAPTYAELKYEAKYNCKFNKPKNIKESVINDLIDVEKKFNVPSGLKGMILAAACRESGFNTNAKGDYITIKNKKLPRAIGVLQQWRWYEKKYKFDRRNHIDAANAWMKHIVKQIPYVKRKCKFRSKNRIWVASWVTAIRYPKPGGRCYEKPTHYKTLKKWFRHIKKSRLEGCEC